LNRYRDAPSILQSEKACYMTGRTSGLERHHIFGGNPNRRLSAIYGLWVYLTHDAHNEPPDGVHHNRAADLELKRIGQAAFEARYPHLDFQNVFGKNYL